MSSDIKTEITTVTPAMAKKWMDKNHLENRPISWSQVESIANDIVSSNWRTTHQGICFDGEGRLIDGQHRLLAIIKANKSVQVMVTHNDSADLYDPIDRGRVRSVAVVTGLHSRVTGSLSLLYRMEYGNLASNVPVTSAEVLETLDHHRQSMNLLDNSDIRDKKSILSGVRAACVWTMPISSDKTLEFLRKVVGGEMIMRGDPAFAFRNWRTRTHRVQPVTMLYAALNCLRHYINDGKLSNVYDTEMGYRAAVSKRRAMRVPHTPGTDLVVGVAWPPST